MTNQDTVEVRLKRTNFFTRWPCHLCGGCTEKVEILAEAETPGGTFRVCETCIKAGDFDSRLEMYASELDGMAALTRRLIGRVKVPTYQEWKDAMDIVNSEDLAEFERLDALEAARSPVSKEAQQASLDKLYAKLDDIIPL